MAPKSLYIFLRLQILTRAFAKQNFADDVADAPSRSADAKADASAKFDDSRQVRVKIS